MRAIVVTLALVATVSWTRLSVAQPAQPADASAEAVKASADLACVAAAEDAQLQRRAGRLLAARDELVTCGRASCPVEVRADCVRWLSEVDHAIPSISVALRDGAGRDVASVLVEVDGHGRADALGTASVALDPGAHHLRVQGEGGPILEEDLLLRPGEKDRVVTLVLPARPAPARPRTRITPVVIAAGALTAAAGAAALSFGVKAVVDRHALDATCPRCAPADITTVKTEAALCDLFLGVFAVGVGTTTWLLLRPLPAPDRSLAGASLTLGGPF